MVTRIVRSGERYENTVLADGAPAFEISGELTELVNTATGNIVNTTPGTPATDQTPAVRPVAAIVMTAGGSTITNMDGGQIRGFTPTGSDRADTAIRGSSGIDRIDNSGSIFGAVSLGGGNDIFVQRMGSFTSIDMGAGDDEIEILGPAFTQTVSGGDGIDRLILNGTISNALGYSISKIEDLRVGRDVTNLSGFSGFKTISLTDGGSNNFIGSNNPDVDLKLANNSVISLVSGTTMKSVTGTAGADILFVRGLTKIVNSIDLSDGNDVMAYELTVNGTPDVGRTINGGAGIDTLRLLAENNQTIDFSNFLGFETIDTGLYTNLTGNVRLINVKDVSQISVDSRGGLILADSNALNANVGFASLSRFTLEANSTVASYGLSNTGSFTGRADLAADSSFSAIVTNSGTILGTVAFFNGDDVYDGSAGRVDGIVYGFSGNDTLTGGTFVDRLDGGRGADTLSGGMGDDVLTGGLGSDNILGGTGDDLAVFERNFADYRFTFSTTEATVTRGTEVDRVAGIERYQFADITINTRDATPLVDDFFYLANNRDVLRAGLDPSAHFATFGWREGRDPNALFDLSAYLGANRDIAAAGINPLDHYARLGYQEGRDPSVLFDSEQYLVENKDVADSGMDPLSHYLAFGRDEGRDIDAAVGSRIVDDFDAAYYLLANEDVGRSGVDARAHYDQFGWKEGRNPNAYFDTSDYLETNGDVAAAGLNPLDHYVRFGWREGRDPSALFDTSAYLQRNGDVAAANIDPLGHYLTYGRLEGRSLDPSPDFAFATSSLALRVAETIFDQL